MCATAASAARHDVLEEVNVDAGLKLLHGQHGAVVELGFPNVYLQPREQ